MYRTSSSAPLCLATHNGCHCPFSRGISFLSEDISSIVLGSAILFPSMTPSISMRPPADCERRSRKKRLRIGNFSYGVSQNGLLSTVSYAAPPPPPVSVPKVLRAGISQSNISLIAGFGPVLECSSGVVAVSREKGDKQSPGKKGLLLAPFLSLSLSTPEISWANFQHLGE